jgi:hypothetical protein
MQIRMQRPRPGDGPGAEIDADAIGWLQRREQAAAAAAQFQHPLAGRNQEAHEFQVVFVISGIERAPAIELIDIALEIVEQIALALAGGLQ